MQERIPDCTGSGSLPLRQQCWRFTAHVCASLVQNTKVVGRQFISLLPLFLHLLQHYIHLAIYLCSELAVFPRLNAPRALYMLPIPYSLLKTNR